MVCSARERAANGGIDADAFRGFRISPEAAAAQLERHVVVLIEAGVADDAPSRDRTWRLVSSELQTADRVHGSSREIDGPPPPRGAGAAWLRARLPGQEPRLPATPRREALLVEEEEARHIVPARELLRARP